MISITTKSPYAVRALVELYRRGDVGPVPIAELAPPGRDPRSVPRAAVRHAAAGRDPALPARGQGGLQLCAPSEVTVLEVVELLDGPLGAGATGVFAEAAEAARAVLAAHDRRGGRAEARAAGAPMYHI